MPGLFGGKGSVCLEEINLGGERKRKVKGAAEWPGHMELSPQVHWEGNEEF